MFHPEVETDQLRISTEKEELCGSLLSIASKLLTSEHQNFHQLWKEEQKSWNSFDNADIYEFLTGKKDTIPEFQYNWIAPEAPALCWPVNCQPAAPAPILPPAQTAQPPAPVQQPEPVNAPPEQLHQPQPIQVSDRVL